MHLRTSFRSTRIACYLGYISQAMVCNFAPLLFLLFQERYGISLPKITQIVAVTFAVQLGVDFLSARFARHLQYRFGAVMAEICAAVGFLGLGILPELMPPYAGILISVSVYAVGSGLVEVLVSPLMDACPSENRSGSMSLLHSFYSFGTVGVILVSVGFFALFGIERWRLLSMLFALIPAGTAVLFMLVPIPDRVQQPENKDSAGSLLRSPKIRLLVAWMIMTGATEQALNQWASAFAEQGLQVPKAVGDLAGPCFFALTMGIARVMYAGLCKHISLPRYLTACALGCVGSFLLIALCPLPIIALIGFGLGGFFVGAMWPGILSHAAIRCPTGGTAMFGILALAGDFGCISGPFAVGMLADRFGGKLGVGILFAVAFPAVMLLLLWLGTHRRYTAEAAPSPKQDPENEEVASV